MASAKKLIAGTLSTVVITGGAVLVAAPAAQAFVAGCAGWVQDPESRSGGSAMAYGATMRCVNTKTSLYRVKATLHSEDVVWGPLPNKWPQVASTSWSANVVAPTYAHKEGIANCANISTEGEWLARGYGNIRGETGVGEGDQVSIRC